MVTTATINVHELLQVADAVSKEKNVDRSIVIEALQDAIARSARQRYGTEYDIRVTIQPKTGNIVIQRYREVVESPEHAENPDNQAFYIPLIEARERQENIDVGDFIVDELPSVEIGRISAQSARQVIVQKIRDAERDSQFQAFKDRVGEIIYGTVKRIEFGNVVISLSEGTEAIIRRNEVIPRENIKAGDRIRCYIYDVRRENSGPQILLSRTHPQFLAKLFASEVPEIYDDVIQIKAVARDPGSRAKIAVYTEDNGIDPVGCCVGMRGGRVQAVSNELQGERIDIIEWSPDAATFIMNALAPTAIIRVVVDEEFNKVEVVVPDDSLSQVIGRRGQNVRLLSHLLGWDVDITTETKDSERRQKDFEEKTELFANALDVDSLLAQFLVTEGFSTLEDIAYIETEEFQAIEGLESSLAAELQQRAIVSIEKQKQETFKNLKMDPKLKKIEGLTIDMLLDLAKHKIISLEDFAGLTADELVYPESEEEIESQDVPYLASYDISEQEATDMIMQARKMMGWV